MHLPFKGIGYEMSALLHGQGPAGAYGRRQACSDIELNGAECLEAYGVAKGSTVCAKFFEDLHECKMARLRKLRVIVMRQERYKKLLRGEISWENKWGAPYDYDSFVGGTFTP